MASLRQRSAESVALGPEHHAQQAAEAMQRATAHAQAMLAERHAAMQIAARALQDQVRPVEVWLTVSQGPNRVQVVAIWRWPGIVRVVCRFTGELIAQSLPGQPGELDTTADLAKIRAGRPCSSAQAFTDAERLGALHAAACRLQDCERLPRAHVRLRWSGRDVWAMAVWHWRGFAVLSERDSGELLAWSLPGQPGELDPASL
jgi:hypothetical protein